MARHRQESMEGWQQDARDLAKAERDLKIDEWAMKPKAFSEIEFSHITFDTFKGSISGIFSELRLNVETIPEGLIPYYIRSNDFDDSIPATIETYVFVNYFGVLIVNQPLDFGGSDHIEIVDWDFVSDTENSPEWAQRYVCDDEETAQNIEFV